MKIGHPAEKPVTLPVAGSPASAVDSTKAGPAGVAPAGVTGAPDASATVELSSTASTLLSSGPSEFDAQKVGQVSGAIANGTFKVHPEVIADKLISNAQELPGQGEELMTVSSSVAAPASTHSPELEIQLAAVESRLAALGNALRARDAGGIELNANELHRALASAVSLFSAAAKNGPLPSALRNRFVQASGQVAVQRETLARATAALDRAMDVLLPREGAALYSIYGTADRGVFKSGVIRA